MTSSSNRAPLDSMSSQGRIVTPGRPARARDSRTFARSAGKRPDRYPSSVVLDTMDGDLRIDRRPPRRASDSPVESMVRSMTSMTRSSSTTRPRSESADQEPISAALRPQSTRRSRPGGLDGRHPPTVAVAELPAPRRSSSRKASTKPRRNRPVPNWRTRSAVSVGDRSSSPSTPPERGGARTPRTAPTPPRSRTSSRLG